MLHGNLPALRCHDTLPAASRYIGPATAVMPPDLIHGLANPGPERQVRDTALRQMIEKTRPAFSCAEPRIDRSVVGLMPADAMRCEPRDRPRSPPRRFRPALRRSRHPFRPQPRGTPRPARIRRQVGPTTGPEPIQAADLRQDQRCTAPAGERNSVTGPIARASSISAVCRKPRTHASRRQAASSRPTASTSGRLPQVQKAGPSGLGSGGLPPSRLGNGVGNSVVLGTASR